MKNKNRTIIVDFGDEDKYQTVISSGKFFLEFVLAYVLSLGFQLLHKEHCTGGRKLFHETFALCASKMWRCYHLENPVQGMWSSFYCDS